MELILLLEYIIYYAIIILAFCFGMFLLALLIIVISGNIAEWYDKHKLKKELEKHK